MTIRLQITCYVILISSFMLAQSAEKPWSLGLDADLQQYNGEFGNQFFSANGNIGFGFNGAKYLTPSWDAMLIGSYGIIKGVNGNDYFKSKGVNLALLAKLKMNNNKILKEESLVKPYLILGLGDYFGSVRDANDQRDRLISPFFSAGAGVEIQLYKSLSLDTRLRYNYLWTDKLDNDITETIINDQLLNVTVGLKYRFSSLKDTDKDGVVDKKDNCPEVAGPEKFNGCPDTDYDGIQDSEDECPNIAGLETLKGCPDSDNDGVKDSEDECPELVGLKELNGCPDSDGDGIKDELDKCPNVAGKINGCPDQDNDGIPDKDDLCPTVAGNIFGCPDRDNDGVMDSKDKCPDLAGSIKNNDCPEVEEVKPTIIPVFKPVYFDFNSALIGAAYINKLDSIIETMQKDETLVVMLGGYSDNIGEPTINKELSIQRAQGVKSYLENKGVKVERITAQGFGETQPAATNETPEGRAKNRRVEFIFTKRLK